MPWILAVACLSCLAVLLRSIVVGDLRTAGFAKAGASAAFVGFGVAAGVLGAGPAGVAVLVALILSAAGDVALIGKDRPAVLAGIALFLAAHLGYVVAFRSFGASPLSAIGALFVLAAPAWWVLGWVGDAKGMRKAVIGYVAVISLMVAMAVGSAVLAGAEDAPWRVGLLASAVLFYASDLAVARERFVVSEVRNRVVGLPLYYVAQLGFAWFTAVAGRSA